jgi:hypothetical protein
VAKAQFVVDPKAVDAMLAQPSVGDHLRQVAEAGAAYARNIAPVYSGRYRDSIEALPSRQEGGEWVGAFGTDWFTWHFVEYGSAKNQPHRVLGQAAVHVADQVTEL